MGLMLRNITTRPVAAMNLPLLFAQVAEGVAPPAPILVPGTNEWQDNARRELYGFHFGSIDAREWEYLALYFGLRAIFALILLTIAWMVSSWISSVIRVALTRVKFDQTLTLFIARLVRWGILLLVALGCLSYFGVETTSVAAVIGAAGLAIGLAFQGTLSNFAAGGMLLVFRPYKVGDVVNVAGLSGKVAEIELFSTAIDTFDNRRIIVPNSSIYGTTIENITFHAVRRVDVMVGVAYSAEIDRTRDVLNRAVASVELVLANPAADVVLNELGASSVNWRVSVWCRREVFGDTKQALIRAIKMHLDEAGIAIPFPQLDIHFDAPLVGERAA